MDLIGKVLEALEPNDKALAGRLVNKDIYARLQHHATAWLSLPLPEHVLEPTWQPHLLRFFQQLTFGRRLRTMSAATASGSETNLELIWSLLEPCLAVGLYRYENYYQQQDPGTVAVRSGNLHLLPWLVDHDCPMNDVNTLAAAAQHCDLAELQQVWEALECDLQPPTGFWGGRVATAAARCGSGAVDKLSWLLSVVGEEALQLYKGRLLAAAAVGSAESGNMPLLEWLAGQGLDLPGVAAELRVPYDVTCWNVLAAALQHGQLTIADWLVDQAGCPLPQQEPDQYLWYAWDGAAKDGSIEAMRWLLRREVPLHSYALPDTAAVGQLAAVRFLHEECGQELTASAFFGAVGSGSLPTAQWLLQAGCPKDSDAYESAASTGDAAVVLWLAREVQVPPANSTLSDILEYWHRDRVPSGGLEPMVRALVEAGFPPGDGSYETDSIGWAAEHGDLRLVRYLHEEVGVPFAPCTMRNAACGGCEPVLEWLVGAGCVPDIEDEDCGPWAWPLEYGLFGTLCCMRQLQVPWDNNVLSVADDRAAPLPVLRWLVEWGAPWDREAVAAAVDGAKRRGAFARTVEWFEARMAEGPPHGGSGAAVQE